MSEIFAEVEEAMRREKLESFWKDYGNIVIVVLLVVVLGTGAYSGYTSWHKGVMREQTDKFMDAEKLNDPVKLAEAAKGLAPGLQTIALIEAAAAQLNKGDKAAAKALYEQILKDGKAPVEFKGMARFMILKTDAEKSAQDKLKELEAIAADNSNIMRFHAHLEAALLLAHEMNDYTAARKHLAVILAESNIPQSLNAKTQGIDIVYALKESEQKKK